MAVDDAERRREFSEDPDVDQLPSKSNLYLSTDGVTWRLLRTAFKVFELNRRGRSGLDVGDTDVLPALRLCLLELRRLTDAVLEEIDE